MKKLSILFALIILGTLVMHSQVKVVLEKDVKPKKESIAANDTVSNGAMAKNDNVKTAEEVEALINELSFRNRDKVVERNKRKSERKSRKT